MEENTEGSGKTQRGQAATCDKVVNDREGVGVSRPLGDGQTGGVIKFAKYLGRIDKLIICQQGQQGYHSRKRYIVCLKH